MNCLQYCLQFWVKNKSYKILYNSNHCIVIEPDYEIKGLGEQIYLDIKYYGLQYFKQWRITKKEYLILQEYINT